VRSPLVYEQWLAIKVHFPKTIWELCLWLFLKAYITLMMMTDDTRAIKQLKHLLQFSSALLTNNGSLLNLYYVLSSLAFNLCSPYPSVSLEWSQKSSFSYHSTTMMKKSVELFRPKDCLEWERTMSWTNCPTSPLLALYEFSVYFGTLSSSSSSFSLVILVVFIGKKLELWKKDN